MAPEVQYVYRARVERVIDGDSLVLLVDLGFQTLVRISGRLLGINAPEMGTPEGREARSFLAHDLLDPAGQVIVASIKPERPIAPDKYGGRWNVVVWLPGADLSLNEQMIEAGHAQPYDGGKRS